MTLNLGSGPAPGPTDGADILQQGVLAATDFGLTLNSTSSVTIAGAPAFWLRNAQGVLVRVTGLTAAITAIPVAVTNRLDQIVVDSLGVVSRIAGASDLAGNMLGTTPATRAGAGTIPAGSQLLWDILVTSAGILIANVRDRRPWARGAYTRVVRTTNAAGGSDYALGISAVPTLLDTANLSKRIECSGAPVRVTWRGSVSTTSALPSLAWSTLQDGTGVWASGTVSEHYSALSASAGLGFTYTADLLPIIGSHLFQVAFAASAAYTLFARATMPVSWTIEELLRPVADNGTT